MFSCDSASYISGELKDYIRDNDLSHEKSAPHYPKTLGKTERWHLTLQNHVLPKNYFLVGDLEHQISSFVEHYNHERYHKNLKNVTPANLYFSPARSILNIRERIKEKTIEHRRLQYRKAVAYYQTTR